MKAALFAGLLLIQQGDEPPVRIAVGCDGPQPVIVRVEMDRPGVVEIRARDILLACEHADSI